MSATDYQVISCKDTDTASLQLRVVTLIAAGWQPTGPVAFANGSVHQALIKGTPVGSGGADYTLPAAADAVIGGVLRAAAQVDTVAADLAAMKVDFNALLAKLRASGAMHT